MCKSSSLRKEPCYKDCTMLQTERRLLRAADHGEIGAAFSRRIVGPDVCRYIGSAAL